MQQRAYRHLTDRERLLISKLRAQRFKLAEIARRIGKDKSTVSRELQRNGDDETPHDRFFYFRVHGLWTAEGLDAYLATQPAEDRETKRVWKWSDAQQYAEERSRKAQEKRRRKKPETQVWVIDKLRLNWSPEQIAGRSKLDGPERRCDQRHLGLLRDGPALPHKALALGLP
jgi:transposase, IS30 family